MRLEIDFDSLDIYMSVYGGCLICDDVIKVYLQGGLGVPIDLRDKFPKRYFYDPWERRKYSELKQIDGLLVGRIEGASNWTKFNDRAVWNEISKYDFVGGGWFVFEGVSFSRRKTIKYTENRESSTGEEFIDEFGSRLKVGKTAREYFLEGVLEVPPGPGWMSWEIHAEIFFVEVPDNGNKGP